MKPSTRELLKSLALGIAALAGLILWLKYQPSPPADWSEKGAGEALCPGFTDADQPQSVTILRPKETDGETALSEIRLAREKDGWVVKNAEDAPADSPDRMAAVLAPLRRLTVLSGLGEINSRTGKSYDNDVAVKAMLQIKDLLMKSDDLKASARNNTEKDFEFAYFDNIDDALIEGLSQNQDFFTLLLQNEEIKREVLGIFTDEIYKSLREE